MISDIEISQAISYGMSLPVLPVILFNVDLLTGLLALHRECFTHECEIARWSKVAVVHHVQRQLLEVAHHFDVLHVRVGVGLICSSTSIKAIR